LAKIRFYNNTHYNINVSTDIKQISFGGQSRIYVWRVKDRIFLIKAMPDCPNLFRRIRDLRIGLGDTKVFSIKYRSLPIGQGFGTPEEFGFKTAKMIYLLVFNYIEGIGIREYFGDNEKPLSPKRICLAKQVLDILIHLQSKFIVHGDLYPDNFIIDGNNIVYILDIESAGITNEFWKNWKWHSLVIGKTHVFPNGPEVEDNKCISTFSDRWIGTYLIFWILCGFHPFPFLSCIDNNSLKQLAERTNRKHICWPPILLRDLQGNIKNKTFSIEKFDTFMSHYFKQYCTFDKIINLTYIYGYDNPQKRPSFREILESLNGVI